MRYCASVPTAHVLELADGAMAMALSHLVEDPAYADGYGALSERGAYVVLNSGAFEAQLAGRPLASLEETLARADRVGAAEIQLPEVEADGAATLERALEWLDAPAARGRRWHAVVEGRDHDDFLRCFDALAARDEVVVLGLAKGIVPRCFGPALDLRDPALARLAAVDRLSRRTDKPFHLLGLDDPREVLLAARFGDRIRSVDSTCAVNHAIRGVRYEASPAPPPPGRRFTPDEVLSGETLARARHNVETLRRWCGDT